MIQAGWFHNFLFYVFLLQGFIQRMRNWTERVMRGCRCVASNGEDDQYEMRETDSNEAFLAGNNSLA